MNDHIVRPTDADLEKARKSARTRRELAWQLLQETRNPEYVALRYGYPIETMRKALEKIPAEKPRTSRSAPAESCHSAIKRAGELLPENLRRDEPTEKNETG